MKDKPSGSARMDLLVMALQMGSFEKSGETYSYDGCEVCDKKFKAKEEVIFYFPKSFKVRGTDLPFDIAMEHGKMCLPCLLGLHKALPNGDKSLQDIVSFAKARIDRDQAQIYVPQAIDPDEEDKKKPV